jgi:hypothetical protein
MMNHIELQYFTCLFFECYESEGRKTQQPCDNPCKSNDHAACTMRFLVLREVFSELVLTDQRTFNQ